MAHLAARRYIEFLRPAQLMLPVVALLAAGLALPGCASGGDARLRETPLLVPPDAHAELRSTPVIDVHAHTYNASMVPLMGIALGKRDALWFLQLVDDRNARCFATYCSSLVYWFEQTRDAERADRWALAQTSEQEGWSVQTLEANPVLRAVRCIFLEKFGTPSSSAELCKRHEKAAAALRDILQPLMTIEVERGFSEFVEVLLTPRSTVPQAYLDALAGHPTLHERHRLGLLVSHTGDLAPVHNQRPSRLLLDYPTEQIEVARAQQEAMGGSMVYFVGYNPFRDHWPHEEPGDALEIVREAISDHGAMGVKFYPPSGYRPIGNDAPSPPIALFTPFPRRQWDARYTQPASDADGGTILQPVTNEQLDARVAALLEYCEDNDIPVFAHCNTGEFEARKGYGVHHSDPDFWKAYLEQRTKVLGRRSELRLCLGHAGGSSFWFGDSDGKAAEQRRWGRLVYELCTTYPNVYCEIGVHGQIGHEDDREHFIEKLAELYEDSHGRPGSSPDGEKRPFPFHTKIMYGTDWFMPSGLTLVNYFDAYEEALLDDRVRNTYYRNFFLNNALRFLNATERRHDERLPAAVRTRLDELVQASDL
ncbi:MAG: amidohydrolase family protein [Planctomycetota bacterium]